MIDLQVKVKYQIKYSCNFKKSYRKISKQGKDVKKLKEVVSYLANDIELDEKYKNHMLIDSKKYKSCYECHIEPDWLLIYKYIDGELILVLVTTGSHSELF